MLSDSEPDTPTSSAEPGKSHVIERVLNDLSYHASYMDIFLKTHNFILRGDGPLPFDSRYIIAMMAVGRHQCCCMVSFLKHEYLHHGGNREWLKGLDALPRKLRKIYTVNKILAHRPWLLKTEHFQQLTSGEDNWSLSEIVHAIIIMVHFHSLSSFVYACGVNRVKSNTAKHECEHKFPDNGNENIADEANRSNPIDILNKSARSPRKDQESAQLSSGSPPSIVGEQEVKVETLMERMRNIREKSVEITQEELSKRFQTIEEQSAEIKVAPLLQRVPKTDVNDFIEDPGYIYQDFSKRGQLNDAPTFRIQDYSWDDHGFSLVSGLYHEIGGYIDEKFKTAVNLTYNTMGEHSPVDTSRFRFAIWNYIQCLYGIRHDDYDYNDVNQLVERSLKTFIKNAVCYPERVTYKDCQNVMSEFERSEKIHLNLIILEARMQAELLYALRTMMRFMT